MCNKILITQLSFFVSLSHQSSVTNYNVVYVFIILSLKNVQRLYKEGFNEKKINKKLTTGILKLK